MWLKRLVEWKAKGMPCAIVTVIAAQGFTPRKTGAKMVVDKDGRSAGSVGGGTAERQCIELARKAIAERTCITQRFVSLAEGEEWVAEDRPLGACGGSLTVFIEPIVPEPELVIFGGGHIGQCLARLCAAIEMPCRVYDDRPEILTPGNFPGAAALICAPFDRISENIELSALSYCVIMTYGHDHDEIVLEQLLPDRDLPYIGMVGSPNKARVLIENIRSRGGEIDDRLYCPVGLSIGRNQPQEIALSILAEIILLCRGGNLTHLRRNWTAA
ncbi:XdhC family protein [Syntrophus aciditrophicus]|nr:XdhC/CoxI family protein [Syntrophus aciditrophicus]OPY16811.1 MAG: putative xanthine dehydrogenase subunit A [Syntrophus sp. PtaB.Bin075]